MFLKYLDGGAKKDNPPWPRWTRFFPTPLHYEPLCHHLDFNLVERRDDAGKTSQEEDMIVVIADLEAVEAVFEAATQGFQMIKTRQN